MPKGYYPRTDAFRQKMSQIGRKRLGLLNSFFGRHHSSETRAQISQVAKEQHKAGIRDVNGKKNGMFGKTHSEETQRKMRLARIRYLQEHPEARRKCASFSTLGKRYTKEQRENISKGRLSGREPKTPFYRRFRNTPEWEEWRRQVYERDNYTCQLCRIRSKRKQPVYLEPHHIFPIAEFPELVFEVSNGITLCRKCHRETKGNPRGHKAIMIMLQNTGKVQLTLPIGVENWEKEARVQILH